MWVEGTANGTYIRRSLKTGSWERATDLGRVIEDAQSEAEGREAYESSYVNSSEYLDQLWNFLALAFRDAIAIYGRAKYP